MVAVIGVTVPLLGIVYDHDAGAKMARYPGRSWHPAPEFVWARRGLQRIKRTGDTSRELSSENQVVHGQKA